MPTDCPERLKQFHALTGFSSLVNSTLDIADIRKRAIESATGLVNAEAGSLLLLDEEKGALYFDVAVGEKGESIKTIHLKKGQGFAGWVAENRKPVISNDVSKDPRFFRGGDEKSGFNTRKVLCLPLKTKTKLVGVLEVMNKIGADFDEEDLEILTALANQIAIAVENAKLYDELREAFYDTVHALADAAEMRDARMGGHTQRVMKYSLAIARIMELSKKDMINLKLAAILHDIGKIGVADSILLKEGQLTDEEYKTVIKHAVHGAEILQHIKHLKDIIPGVKYYHENYDGTGYPDGLKGENIPLISRIIAVANALDMMTSDGLYRNSMHFDEAVAGLKKGSGTRFDHKVLYALEKAYTDGVLTV